MTDQQALVVTTHSQRDQTQGNDARDEDKDIEAQCPSKVVEFLKKKTKLKPLVRLFLQWYDEILVFIRALAVTLDPLFFYVPVIKEDKKCIGLNKVLWTIAFVSRSVTDVVFLVHFLPIYMIAMKRRDQLITTHWRRWATVRRHLWSLVFNVLVILPIPQVVMPSIFSEMRRTKSSNIAILNSVILLQYGPRLFHIHRYWKLVMRVKRSRVPSLWIKVSLYLFPYIFAGHVLGAFWYFFSTQRLTACWHKACEIHSDGVEISFNCDHSFRKLSFLDDFCPIDTPNPSTFDFGIFLEARQSGILESTGLLRKAVYCFWWGMRNLSSFGSNLQTSSYIWEDIFALGISIFGLLLFIYFIGNLQTYMQWRTTNELEEESRELFKNWDEKGMKWEEMRMRSKWHKRQKQHFNLQLWMSKYGFDRTTRDKIFDYIYKSYEADEDVYVETLILDLPCELRSAVNRHICLNLLKSLKIIKDSGLARHESLLLEICDSLQPMFYDKYCYIVREGDPIDAVFFITNGIVRTYTSNNGEGFSITDDIVRTNTSNNGEGSDSQHAKDLEKDKFFGGELLELVLKSTADDISKVPKVPVSSKTLKTYTKVEAFALMAHDLKRIWQSKRINPRVLDSFTCTTNPAPQSPENV